MNAKSKNLFLFLFQEQYYNLACGGKHYNFIKEIQFLQSILIKNLRKIRAFRFKSYSIIEGMLERDLQ